MRWYLEKSSDPEQIWYAEFGEAGEVTLRTGAAAAPQTETLRFDSQDAAIVALRERAAPYLSAGYVQSTAPEDRYRNHPRIRQFWEEEVEDAWRALGATPCPRNDTAELTRLYFGRALPPELDRLLELRSTHRLGFCNYGEWRLWDSDIWLPRRADGNLFEQLVCMDQDNILSTAMMQHFVGWVPIGSAGNGDLYLACPNAFDPTRCDVLFFDHETHSIRLVITDSPASLAWLNHCYLQLGDDDFDADALKEDFALLQDRAQLPWHYEDLESETGIEPQLRLNTIALRDFRRCRWIDYLLSQGRVDEAEAFFSAETNDARFEDALGAPYLRAWTSTALYWLWRLWWFAKPELAQCLDAVADHPSPIVTDCVALIRELEAGRSQLGKIADIHALRERFLALDLDPDRAEARAAEQAVEADQANQRAQQRLAEARTLIGTGDLGAIREALWDYAGDTEARDALVDHLEQHDAEARPWIRRWRFLATRASNRDGKAYSFEDDEVKEVLSHGGAVVGPLFAQPDDLRALLPAAYGGPRAKPIFLAALEMDDEFRRGTTAGAQGLAILGATEAVPRLVELSRSLRWSERDFVGKIQRDDALVATIDALAVLGGPEATRALVELLDAPALADPIWPRVLTALGRLGDADAVDAVIPHLAGDAARPALFALAHLGTDAARTAIDAHLASKVGEVHQLAYELAMQQLARHGTGDPVDWALVEQLALVVESRRYEDQELHETLAVLLRAHPDRGRGLQMLTEYLHSDHRRVREAALASLDAMGARPELRWMDRPTVQALWEEQGLDGLRHAMTDPHAIFRHNVLRKAVEEGVGAELSDEAVALGRLYCRFTAYTNPFTQSKHTHTYYLVRALVQLETDVADRFLCELWKGPVPMYREEETMKYGRDGLHERLQRFVAAIEAEKAAAAPAPPEPGHAVPFARVEWLFGGCINGMCWSPDGARLALGGAGGVKLLDRSGQVVRDVPPVRGAHVYDVDFAPDGALLAIGVHGGHLLLVDPSTGAEVARLKGHGGVPNGVRKVRFSPSGTQLASVSNDQTARIWDVATRTCKHVYTDPADINAVDWVDEEHIVIGTDRMVRLLTSAGEELKAQSASGTAETRVCRSRERIYVGSAGKLRVYSLKLAEKRKEHLSQASIARIRVAGDTLVATSWEGDAAGVTVWDLQSGTSTHLGTHRVRTFALDLHPASGEIGIGGDPGYVERFTPVGEPIPVAGAFHTQEIEGMRADGAELLTAAKDGRAIRWSSDGQPLATYLRPKIRVCDAASAGSRVFVTGTDFTGCFDRETGALLWEAAEPPSRSEHLSLAADDAAIVVAGYRSLRWLDRETGAVLHETGDFIGDWWLHWWAELPGGRLAVAGYQDEALHVFDTATRERLGGWVLPKSKKGGICGMAAAGGRLFVSRWDKTVVVLDATTGEVGKTATLDGTRYPIAPTADGSMLFAASGRVIEVYDTTRFRRLTAIEAAAKVEVLAVQGDQLRIGCGTGELLTATVPTADSFAGP